MKISDFLPGTKKKKSATSAPAALPGMGPLGAAPDTSKMNMLQRLAWKQFQKMSPDKQREVMKKAMTPENIRKNRAEILAQLDQLKASGMMSNDQYRLAKRRMGLE